MSSALRARREPALPRYEEIARRYAAAIGRGTLAPGERFPSVRRLAAEEGASVSTVLAAIAQLEALGLVEARPRSGHFVRLRSRPPPPRPTVVPARAAASRVEVAELVARVFHAARDPRVVNLSHATPDPSLLPARGLARALSSAVRGGEGGLRYEMPPGHLELRQAIARRALSWGCDLGADDLVVTGGATEAIQLGLLAAVRPGDVVALESPAYYGTLQALEALGLRVVEVPCLPDVGMDLDELERRIDRHGARAVLAVPSFSNPLGSCMPEAARERLAGIVSRRGIPLLEDDVYGELAFGTARPRPVKAFDRDGSVMLCSSFSKTLAPGYRIGFAAPGRWRERVELLKFSLSVATATPVQRAVARYLRGGGYDRHLRLLREQLSRISARTAAAVADAFPPGTRVSTPAGGCFLWVEMPAGVDSLELHARSLDAGVSIAPGPIFSPAQGHRSCIRLSCGAPWDERIDAAVRLVGRLATRLAP
ncbi:MAG TPA: PLP-dependent aminotransferase family protein [Anaeromyxobacter sp.]|nr:PLP-dependent aminotransferase family protein [Anaeromyxobacter sp.]